MRKALHNLVLIALFVMNGCAAGDPPVDQVDSGTMNLPDMTATANNTIVMVDVGADVASTLGEECDPFVQDCTVGKCVPNASTGKSTCLPDVESRAEGEECATIAQCAPGTHCTATSRDPASRCHTLCPAGDDTLCSAGTTCAATLASHPTIGICLEPPEACDIYAQDCAGSQSCIVSRDAAGDVGTFCGAAGDRTLGQPCGDANGNCEGGFICVRLASAEFATCQPVCRETDAPCPTPLDCTGTAASSGVDFCE